MQVDPAGELKLFVDKSPRLVGESIIKRFAATLEPSSRKITDRIVSKRSIHDHDSQFTSNENNVGLRADYKAMLEERRGFPWDDIRKSHLKEQLIELALQGNCTQEVINLSKAPFAMEVLGKLILLFERGNITHITPEWINEAFDEELKKILNKLEKHYFDHKRSMIQSADIALMTQLSIELARLIITERGGVNFGIIPTLIRCFVDEPQSPLNHEINIIYALKSLLSSPILRQKLGNIKKPNSTKSHSNQVIRAVLDLPVTVDPTDLHARQTALSGLLSHVRQGSDGSCFATPIVIGLLSSELEKCLDDFASLISEGKLKRKIRNIVKDFSFLLRVNNKSLNQQISLCRDGLIHGCNTYLWEVPGFIKACRAIDIADYEKIYKLIVYDIFKNSSNDLVSIKVRKVLKYLAGISDQSNQGIIFNIACFAFEGQICNPLLGVWENTIASMAEGDEGSLVTSTIIRTSLEVLEPKIKELTPENVETILNSIRDSLRQRIHLQYDPVVHHASLSKDQRTTEGAFVLYDAIDSIRIDNPLDYKSFMTRVLKGIPVEGLIEYVNTDEFLQSLLDRYKPKHSKSMSALSDPKRIKYAPWITRSGNNFSKVVQTYFESPEGLPTTVFRPDGAQNLFIKIGEFARSLPRHSQEKLVENPYALVSARVTGVHAFSLLLGHPSFRIAWKDNKDLNQWIYEKVIRPGKAIALTATSEKFRKKLIRYVIKNLIDANMRTEFERQMSYLGSVVSLFSFRNAIVQHIGKNTKRIQLLDGYMYQHLPIEIKERLNHSAVHVGDTNWGEGLNDLHFCFVVNPGTRNLEIWASHDDKKSMQPLDQVSWLQEWEVFSGNQ